MLAHFDYSESEQKNQLPLIEGQLFVNPVQDETAGETKVQFWPRPHFVYWISDYLLLKGSFRIHFREWGWILNEC